MKSLILLAALGVFAHAQDPRAPESLCAFSVRPFDERELRALSAEAMDQADKAARLFICKRRVLAEIKELQKDMELHPDFNALNLRRYAVVAQFAKGDAALRALEGKIAAQLSLLLAERPATALEDRWLGALPPERRQEVLRDSRRLASEAAAGPAPARPQTPAPRAKPVCEPDICEAYARRNKRNCSEPSPQSPSPNCRALAEAMAGCSCR